MNIYEVEVCKFIDTNWEAAKENRKKFFGKMQSSKYVCLFGAGNMGKDIACYMKELGINISFFCDNNENLWAREIYNGIKCISVEDLKKYQNDVFVLISTGKYKEIQVQLKEIGFDIVTIPTSLMLKSKKYLDTINSEVLKSKIRLLFDVLEDEESKMTAMEIIKKWFLPVSEFEKYNYSGINSGVQYFPKDIINLSDREVFVDAGAYDGDTIEQFLIDTNYQFEKIIAYELDKNCYDKLEKNIFKLDNCIRNKIILNNVGLYDNNQIINYSSNETSSSISSSAKEEGKVVKLADHYADEITFLKMDIEGAEVNALEGASASIVKFKPTLAICVYHEPWHLWEIPLYLKKLVPEYRLYIRHHSDFNVDTVCYAVL